MSSLPTFLIGDVPVHGDIIFAPMAGFADVPTRSLYRLFGSALQYTEFVAAEDVLNGAPKIEKLLDFAGDERPKVIQLFGNDAKNLLEAALKVEELAPELIDINMGCSTRRVSRRGSGVGMMKNLDLIEETFSLLTNHLDLPVTAKMRLGWEENQNYIEVGKVLEGCGAAGLTLHPRTKEQKYGGAAQWDAIAAIKEAVSIPVIGNGDINYPAHIDKMLSSTGCDAVMIGRGAIGNPWIISRIDRARVPISEVVLCVRDHFQMMIDYYGTQGMILFRKHVKRYFTGLPDLGSIVRQLVQCEIPGDFIDLLGRIEALYGGLLVGEMTGKLPSLG